MKLKFVPIIKMLIVSAVVALIIVFIFIWFKSLLNPEYLMINSLLLNVVS